MASIKLKGDTSGEVTISAPSVAGTTTLELPATSSTLATQNSLGVRNLIINGDMRIDQRNAGASVTQVDGASFVSDRFYNFGTVSSKFTSQQVTDAPEGFNYSIKNTSSSSYTVGSAEQFWITQKIEGYNIAHLNWGTSDAKTVTLSFWVKSSLTGTFGGSLTDVSRSYPFSYTISSANTWEKKTITIAGDTSGTWTINNGTGVGVYFSLGSGSNYQNTSGSWHSGNYKTVSGATSLVGTSGATLYITGVQLEVGTATPFEHRPFDMELQRCQRYCYRFSGNKRIGLGAWNSDVQADIHVPLPTTMRIPPSITVNANGQLLRFAIAWYNISSIIVSGEAGETQITLAASVGSTSGATRGEPSCIGGGGGSNPDLVFSAEL